MFELKATVNNQILENAKYLFFLCIICDSLCWLLSSDHGTSPAPMCTCIDIAVFLIAWLGCLEGANQGIGVTKVTGNGDIEMGLCCF